MKWDNFLFTFSFTRQEISPLLEWNVLEKNTITYWLVTVSYTHLDVYKRQTQHTQRIGLQSLETLYNKAYVLVSILLPIKYEFREVSCTGRPNTLNVLVSKVSRNFSVVNVISDAVTHLKKCLLVRSKAKSSLKYVILCQKLVEIEVH